MDIIKNLYQNNRRVGVLIEDGTERYPIPLEGLFARTIFDELKKSGYTLTNVEQFEFVKNGCKISDLPGANEEWKPSETDEMIFANTTSTYEMIPIAERYTLCENVSVRIAERTGNYAIKTREEFLKYIESIANGCADNDFLPVNYFVAPEARFQLVELMADPTASRAMNILAERRKFNFARLQRLKNFLAHELGMSVSTPTEIIDGYMEWGFDGLDFGITGKNTEICDANPMVTERAVLNEPFPGYAQLQKANARFHSTQYILVGKDMHDQLFPGDIDGVEPLYKVSDQYKRNPIFTEVTLAGSKFHQRRDRLGLGEYGAEQIYLFEQQPVRTWYMLDAYNSFVYTNEKVRLNLAINAQEIRDFYNDGRSAQTVSGNFEYNNLCVRDPSNFYTTIPLDLWDNHDLERLNKITTLRSLARDTYLRGEVPCDKTSYSILIDMGVAPINAIRFIANTAGFYETPILMGEDDKPLCDPTVDKYLTDDDILSYFEGGCTGDLIVPSIYDNGTIVHNRALVEKGTEGLALFTVERKVELIESIMSGAIDLGKINKARAEQMLIDATPTYKALYCLHFILGMPIDMIAAKCREYDNQGAGFAIEYAGKRVFVPVPRCDLAAKAAVHEEMNLHRARLRESPTFFMVYDVARELSNNENLANMPIGVAGVFCRRLAYKVNGKGTDYSVKATGIDEVIAELVDAYCTDKLDGKFLPANEREQIETDAQKASRLAILTYYAYGSLNSITGCPADWSGILLKHNEVIQASCGRFADSLLAVTSDYLDYAKEDGTFGWNYYCVNANIYPNEVVPHGALSLHETNLRAVFDYATIEQNFQVLVERALIARNTYFSDPNSCWSSYDYREGHLNGVPHIVKDSTAFYFEYVTDSTLYANLSGCTPMNYEEYYNELLATNPRYKILMNYSLNYYFRYATALRNQCPQGMWFVAPKHPLLNVYPAIYEKQEEAMSNAEYRPIVDPATDKTNYPVGKAAAIVGPQYDNVSGLLGGLPVKQPVIEKMSHLALTAAPTVVRGNMTRLTGFTSEEIMVHPDLICLDFGNRKPITMLRNMLFVNYEHIELDAVSQLNTDEYAVCILDGRTCIFMSDTNELWRVTV